jgi:hypothetical protein
MAITVDWASKIVNATSSITDIVAFKDTLRDLEDNDDGILYPPIITYKRLDLGGGAFFHAVDFINEYRLRFSIAGNYTIVGNISAAIVPVAGVFVDRTKSAAFATVAGTGGGGVSAAQIWQHVVEAGMSAEEVLRVMVAAMAGKVSGAGTTTEIFRSIDDTRNVITATVDAQGNRTAITLAP